MKLFVFLILAVFASENENDTENDPKYEENPILVKIEEDEYAKVNKKFKHIGVSYNEKRSKWFVQRWSKDKKKVVANGYYDDEETAEHASDTLARKFMENGEQNHKLNFPDDYTEVYPEEKITTSNYIGVGYNESVLKWYARRWRKNEHKYVYNGGYDDEETAAHASDTLARKLMENGKQKLKLNFPDNYTKIYPETICASKFIGVTYDKSRSKWRVQRWSRHENKNVRNGCYDNEETAAHASDTLARKLMKNGEQKLKLNFTADYTEENHNKKRKRPQDVG